MSRRTTQARASGSSGERSGPPGWPTLLAALAVVGWAAAGAGCSQSHRRLGEFEAVQLKRQLVKEHHEELTSEQQLRLMQHPARTRAELEAALETYRAQFRAQAERDRAAWHATGRRSGGDEAEAPPGGDAGDGGGVAGGPGEAGGSGALRQEGAPGGAAR